MLDAIVVYLDIAPTNTLFLGFVYLEEKTDNDYEKRIKQINQLIKGMR